MIHRAKIFFSFNSTAIKKIAFLHEHSYKEYELMKIKFKWDMYIRPLLSTKPKYVQIIKESKQE